MIAADLVARGNEGRLEITAAGRAHLARLRAAHGEGDINPYLGQHVALARQTIEEPDGKRSVTINEAESPLVWLARRKDRDGNALISPEQLQAGERLRLEFTRAQLMPRITANWQASVASSARGAAGGRGANVTDVIVGARQNFRRVLDAAGPEFSGLLVDVCCFLKSLADVESERHWPTRSAKVVLQLGLDRLARHYGLGVQARGRVDVAIRTWLAPGAAFVVDDLT